MPFREPIFDPGKKNSGAPTHRRPGTEPPTMTPCVCVGRLDCLSPHNDPRAAGRGALPDLFLHQARNFS